MGQHCPNPEELKAFCLGKLGEPPFESVAQHLDDGAACQSTLESLAALDDTLAVELRRSAEAEPIASDPECDRAVEQVIQNARELAHAMNGDEAHTAAAGGANPTRGAASTNVTPAQIGQYRIIQRIGMGGMGTVYKAVHTKLKRTVALKVLPTERLRDPSAVARFSREMEAVGK